MLARRDLGLEQPFVDPRPPDGYMTYHPRAQTNVLGGLCVFGSYNYNFSVHPHALV